MRAQCGGVPIQGTQRCVWTAEVVYSRRVLLGDFASWMCKIPTEVARAYGFSPAPEEQLFITQK
ncbi:hypothetical protein [Piscirickettsia salmonis]|uniref:hypothetical protein n=1 Tax=Piscirickettsia salmonis TaxID=1238 RepID=UPI00143DB1A8|nr:hypothetical protein [Piscirickettsia salmonis]QIX57347.1 hypothetical protein GW536_18190 [Piscirickettsia salmonis]